jgi:hypothetical protein
LRHNSLSRHCFLSFENLHRIRRTSKQNPNIHLISCRRSRQKKISPEENTLTSRKEIKMKKWIFATIAISLIQALSACGSAASATATAGTSNTLSLEGQLLVGTFKLENTSLAITSAQASTLLPLWETLESLASSNTAASQEVDAVVSQIQSSLSAQQVSSITAMKLTRSDLAATAVNTGTASSTSSSATTAKTRASQQQSGGPNEGIPPSGASGGGIPGGTDVQSITQAQTGSSASAVTPAASTSSQVSAAMIKAVVELLQKKIG